MAAKRGMSGTPSLTARMIAAVFGLNFLLVGCASYGGLTQETMAACIAAAGITGPYSASSSLRNNEMTFLVRTGPNVSDAQAATANACIARTIDSPLPAPQAGGLEQRTVVRADGNRITETYTYGNPPAAVAGPARQSAFVLPRQCNLQIYGGSGYRCVPR